MIERYYMEEMKGIWSEKSYYRRWIQVEAALLKVRGLDSLAERLEAQDIEPAEIKEHEKTSGHELNSFLDILQERIGAADSGEIHKGLTSSDVMDTARVMQIRDSLELTLKKLEEISGILRELAARYKETFMCGRTHGQYAEPVTLGLKFARWYAASKRNIERVKEARKRILAGKISGAVGTYSLVEPEEEKKVLSLLGLQPAPAASQVVPRDPFAEYLFILALISAAAEEIALEIRLLSQDGIKEAAEPFTSKQTGSSAMPHKKNPVICERICGLSRLVASYVGTGLSNIALWNERDISHSSNERIILEESSSVTYYILDRLEVVLRGITVNRENIEAGLKAAGMKLFSSAVLKLLLDSGATREKAYRKVQEMFMQGRTAEEIKNLLAEECGLDAAAAGEVLSLKGYMKNIDAIYERLGIV